MVNKLNAVSTTRTESHSIDMWWIVVILGCITSFTIQLLVNRLVSRLVYFSIPYREFAANLSLFSLTVVQPRNKTQPGSPQLRLVYRGDIDCHRAFVA
ncbi:MAG: hypothetical protein MAG451_00258 [Anaerolineales bacterium]|nr:hypothetical protein [Anaerolineales bacterium]